MNIAYEYGQSRQLYGKQTVDIHAPYWEALQGDIRYYYDLRERLTAGILKGSGFSYKQLEDQTFTLVKEA